MKNLQFGILHSITKTKTTSSVTKVEENKEVNFAIHLLKDRENNNKVGEDDDFTVINNANNNLIKILEEAK